MIKTHASLFSGIGAAEIAADWMGWQNAFHCEIQEFPRRVLDYWYPNSVSYEDITKTDFTPWRGKIDILTGGFPCQPFSCAGQRRGADDNRYLWPEMLRAIREIQPSWVVGENVTGLLSMVQPGEEAKMGRTDALFQEDYVYRKEQRFTLDEICEGLERAGYAVQPFVIPACAVGAPHRRDRVWIVARLAAHPHGDRRRHGQDEQEPVSERGGTPDDSNGRKDGLAAHRNDARLEEVGRERQDGVLSTGASSDTERCGGREMDDEIQSQQPNGQGTYGNGLEQFTAHANEYGHTPRQACEGAESGGRRYVSQPCERGNEAERPDGLPRLQRVACDTDGSRLERGTRKGLQGREYGFADASLPADRWRDFPTQSPVCSRDDELSERLVGITFPRWRAEAIKALGNAMVPAVVYEIFRAIAQVDNETENDNEYETTHTAAG